MYSHDPASSVAISRWPLLRDPWEDAMVEVAQSRLEQAGEVRDNCTPILVLYTCSELYCTVTIQGLFAKTDLPAKTIIALFAGVRLKTSKLSTR